MDRRRVLLRVRGRVQGVNFRASARAEALRLGLVGWVRNLDDGSVEALAEGSASALDAFAAWCAEGPPAARVDGLERSDAPATGELSGFAVEPRR